MTDTPRVESSLVNGCDQAQAVSGDGVMQARLRLLELAITCSADELLTATLDEMEALTGSSIAFYHFVDADQKTLSLRSWSTNTSKMADGIPARGTSYDIERVGVWGECVPLGRPVLDNHGTKAPLRKEIPGGHAAVAREAVVPITRGGKVTAIVGVGNKQADYDRIDVDVLCRFGDLSWDIVERKLAEEALRCSEEEKTVINEIDKIFLTALSEKLHEQVAALAMKVTKSRCAMFGHLARSGALVVLFAGRTPADGPVPASGTSSSGSPGRWVSFGLFWRKGSRCARRGGSRLPSGT